MKKELKHICFLQFIGPIFVVLGHSLNGNILTDSLWWYISKSWIYTFHMPLFFMISGYLLANNSWMGKHTYIEFTKNKFRRLLISYFSLNIIFSLLDVVVNGVDSLASNIINMIFYPKSAILGHTWYLMVIFVLYLFVPAFRLLYIWCDRLWKYIIVYLILLLVWFLPFNTYFLGLLDIHRNIIYFVSGMFMYKVYSTNKELFKSKVIIICDLIMIIVYSFFRFEEQFEVMDFVLAFMMLWILFQIPIFFEINNEIITFLSRRSMIIYLLHWPCMYFFRLLFAEALEGKGLLYIVLIIQVGYWIPIFVMFLIDKLSNCKFKRGLLFLLGLKND